MTNVFETRRFGRGSVGASLLFLAPLFGVGPSFKPDATVKGSSLNGCHVLGQAAWKAQAGEITGTVKPGGDGGWLVLDHSYQDAGFYASLRCAEGCKSGVLLRAEKTPQGVKGIFVSLTSGDVAPYRIGPDSEGKELTREKLRAFGGMTRIATPPDPNAAGRGGRGAGGGRGATAPGPTLPFTRPSTDFRTDDWNQVEISIDANMVHTILNSGAENSVGED
jgi:hypothetical protein